VRRGNAFAACERVLASMPRQSHASALPLRPASVDQQLSFGRIASELGPGLRVHRCSRVVARRESRGPSSTDSRTEQERTDLARAESVQSQLRAFLARGRRADLRPIPRARTGSFTQPHQRALCRSQRAERSAGTPVGRDTLANGSHARSNSERDTTPRWSAGASVSAATAPSKRGREARRRVEFP